MPRMVPGKEEGHRVKSPEKNHHAGAAEDVSLYLAVETLPGIRGGGPPHVQDWI